MIVPAPPIPSRTCAVVTARAGAGPPKANDEYMTVIAPSAKAERTWTKRRKSYTPLGQAPYLNFARWPPFLERWHLTFQTSSPTCSSEHFQPPYPSALPPAWKT